MDGKAKLLIIGFCSLLVLTSISGANHLVKSEIVQKPSQLVEAEKALQDAFVAVLEAEQAGASITGLIDQLNSYIDHLAHAEMSFRTGNISGAIDKIASIIKAASEVKTEAVNAQSRALTSSVVAFRLNVVLSFAGGFFFVLLLYVVWKLYRLYYIKRLSTSKPEVRTIEA